jgi:putative tryptophan/tyrosine transport system substrate-binding protein
MTILRVTRREFVATLGSAAAWPMVAHGQQKVFQIGVFFAGRDNTSEAYWAAFVQALRELGWIEGKHFIFVYRFANNRVDDLPELANELVALNVDIIVAGGTLAPLAAKHATSTIPIIMSLTGDPLASGLVTNLARPGGNVTGLSGMAPEAAGKRLELLKEVLPQLTDVAVLWNSANPYSANGFKETQSAAKKLGVNIQSLGVKGPDELTDALTSLDSKHPDALVTIDDPLTLDYRQQIIDIANANKLPEISALREFVDVGGLLGYGASVPDFMRRAAGYVDKVLKGANPGDLPVEQPTKFQIIINLKTAKRIGLQIPTTILARADEVIE